MRCEALNEVNGILTRLGLAEMRATSPEPFLARLDALPTSLIAQAEQDFSSLILQIEQRPSTPREILTAAPHWAPVLLFHRSGFVREAALRMIGGPARSAFAVAGIAIRLNDWVEPVRQAAADCARRVFPATRPQTMAAAVFHLGPRIGRWGRLGTGRGLLDEAFARPGVVVHLAAMLMEQRQGASPFAGHLRTPALDGYLLAFARSAAMPDVRGLALRTLMEGQARWRTGWEKRWIGKSHGFHRHVPRFATRPVERPCGIAELVAIGLADPAIGVRRAVLDTVMTAYPERVPPELVPDALIARLAAGRSPSLRQRADYLRRQRNDG